MKKYFLIINSTIKNIILLALAALMVVGCNEPVTIDNKEGLEIVNIDSCEYIKCDIYGVNTCVYSHKGNCRFCKERRQKELEELIIKLKEK